jgi:hypothetical protein
MSDFATVDVTTNVDFSALDDLQAKAEEVGDNVSNALANIPISADASDFNSVMDEAQSKADELAGKDVNTTLSADASQLDSACSEAESKLSSLEEKASSVESMMSNLFTGVEAVIAVAAIDEVIGKMDDLVGKYAEMEDIANRAAMFGGNTTPGGIGNISDAIMKQSDEIAMTYGLSNEKVAQMEGTLRQYGTNTQKMTTEQIGQYAALARGMQQDPAAVAEEVMKTVGMTGITDTQRIMDVASKAYMTTGTTLAEIQRPLMQLQPFGKELGGLEGQVATLEALKQAGVPTRMSASGLASGIKDFEKSTDAYIDAKGKMQKAEGIGAIFQAAGLSSDVEKSRGFAQAMIDLLNASKSKGTDFFKELPPALKIFAESQPKIQEFTAGLKDSSTAVQDLTDITNTGLTTSLARVDETFRQIDEEMGSLFEGPAKSYADWFSTIGKGAIDKFINSLKAGDIKGAIHAAFDLGNLVLTSPVPALDAWKDQILSYDWKSLGQEVAKGLGSEMSNINIDAAELGKTVAAGLAAALDLARGLLGGQDIGSILFGKTPLDSFLKPLEQVMGAEFRLMGAQIKLEVDKGTLGAQQGFIDFHNKATDAIAGVENSVIDLVNLVGGDLVSALNKAGVALGHLKSGDFSGAYGVFSGETSTSRSSISGPPEIVQTDIGYDVFYAGHKGENDYMIASGVTKEDLAKYTGEQRLVVKSYQQSSQPTVSPKPLYAHSAIDLSSSGPIGDASKGTAWWQSGGAADRWFAANIPGASEIIGKFDEIAYGKKDQYPSLVSNNAELGTSGMNFESSAMTGSALPDLGMKIDTNVKTTSDNIVASNENTKSNQQLGIAIKEGVTTWNNIPHVTAQYLPSVDTNLTEDTKAVTDAQLALDATMQSLKTSTDAAKSSLDTLDVQGEIDKLLYALPGLAPGSGVPSGTPPTPGTQPVATPKKQSEFDDATQQFVDSCLGGLEKALPQTADDFYKSYSGPTTGCVGKGLGPKEGYSSGFEAPKQFDDLTKMADQTAVIGDLNATANDQLSTIAGKDTSVTVLPTPVQVAPSYTTVNVSGMGTSTTSSGGGVGGGSMGGQYGSAYGGWYQGGAKGLQNYMYGPGSGNTYTPSGRYAAFAEGDIFDQPIEFASGNRRGVFGEDGAEAIVPIDNHSAGQRILSKIAPSFPEMFSHGGDYKAAPVIINVAGGIYNEEEVHRIFDIREQKLLEDLALNQRRAQLRQGQGF